MNDNKIHFSNVPFMAYVESMGDELIECTPVVYGDGLNYGISVLFPNMESITWGLVTPRNLITAWRGTEILRHIHTIENGTLCAAYYTGIRSPHESDMKSYVEPIIKKIGRDVYDTIMSMTVPEQIIRAILDNQNGDSKPDLYPITDEVRAGTIEWRQEFVEFGIKHPDDVDNEERLQKETIAKFERLLASYARSRSIPRNCMGMNYVESALLTLVDKKANEEHSDNVLIALSGVVGELSITNFAAFILPFGISNQAEYDARINKTKEEALEYSASWLASISKPPWFSFLRKKETVSFTSENATKLLRELLEKYFPRRKKLVTFV